MPVQVSYDSELMDQLVPADPIAARRFTTVLDENKRPLVFSIGNDNIFYLVIADENGINSRQDLGARLGFQTTAQAFAVSQREDGKIIIVFAMKHAGDSYGDIRILGPIAPSELREEDIYLRSFLLRTVGQPSNLTFERILLGPFASDNNPVIIAVHRNARDTDIAQLALDVAGGTMTWRQNLDLPQNAASLTDLTPAVTVYGKGVFYLYKSGGQQSLVFITSDEGSNGGFYRVDLGIPANQEFNALSTFKDSQGRSRLVTAGVSGLYQYKTIRNGAQPTRLSDDPLYVGVSNLYIAQSDDEVSVWFKNSSQTLGYHRGNRTLDSVFDSARPPIPFTTPGSGVQFSPIIDPFSKSQRLLITDSFGNLTLKEQAFESQLWTETPFVVPSLEKNITIQTYTVLVKLTNDDGSPFAEKEVLLASSAWVNVTVNGKNLTATSTGVPVKTDANGTFTMMVPTNDISSYQFSIKDHGGSRDFPAPPSIDPTRKVVAKLGGMTSAKLRDAKDADGNPLVSGSVSQADLESAAQAMSNMHNVIKELPAATSSNTQAVIMAKSSGGGGGGGGPENAIWGAWNWIKEKVTSAVQWIVKKVGQAWRFVVTLAGKVWDFILDTAERVMKAFQFVFEKIGVAFQKLVQWLGFIFKWGDILEVSDGITSMVNGVLDFSANFIQQGSVIVDDFFTKLENDIRQSTGVGSTVKETSANQSNQKDEKSKSALDSAPANWSNYQLNHNGVKENLRPVTQVSGDPSIAFIWTDLVQPIWQDLKQRTSGLIDQITNVYKQNPNASLGDVFKIVGVEVLLGLLGLIKNVAAGLIRVGAGIIRQLRNLLNMEIRVPVIGALFKLIVGGRPLTLLNAVSLLVAVPVTIVAKIVTGEKPKKIVNFDYGRLVGGTLDSTTLLAYNELADWVSTIYYVFNGFVEIYRIATYQIPEVPESPTSPTLLSIILKLVVVAFTFPYDRTTPRWPVRVSIWGVKAGHILLGSALQRLGPSVKAIVAFDIAVGLACFSMATVVNDGEFDATATQWKGKDDASTALRTALSILELVSVSASSYGQLAPEPFEKGAAVIVVGGIAGGSSVIKGILAGRKRANLT